MRRLLAVVFVAGLVAVSSAGCSGAGRPEVTDETLGERACSADGMQVGPVDSDGMPSAVAATRQELIDTALACDYRGLARLVRHHGVDVRIEGEVVPPRQFAEREHDGQPILRPLAGLLGLAHAREEGRFTWPTAVEWPFADVAPGRERAELVDVVGEEGVFGWTEAGGYAGWRTSIANDGTWTRLWYGPVPGEYG